MKEKEKLIMVVEDATTRLKVLIENGISTNQPQYSIKLDAETLIEQTRKLLEEQTEDDEFVESQIIGLHRLYVRWTNLYLLGLNQVAKTNKSGFLADVLNTYKLLNKDGEAIKPLKNGGLTLVGSDKDLFLANSGISNIRELMTNPVEGGVGRYVDYGAKIKEEISRLQQLYALDPAAVTDAKGNKKNLRAMAEIKVRYDLISDDLKGKDVKYVMASSHPNASERCSWWQGKIFIVDTDVESRQMYQYDESKASALCKPIGKIDGRDYYSLKDAISCGFLSYNCQHRLIKYYKGIQAPRYNLIDVERKRNQTTIQRSIENKVRQTKMIESISGRNTLIERKNPFTGQMEQMKASDYSKLLQDYYKGYCEKHNLVQYTWRLRITQEERGNK